MGRVGSREHKNGLWRQVETLVPEAHAKAAYVRAALSEQPDRGGAEARAGQTGAAGRGVQAGS